MESTLHTFIMHMIKGVFCLLKLGVTDYFEDVGVGITEIRILKHILTQNRLLLPMFFSVQYTNPVHKILDKKTQHRDGIGLSSFASSVDLYFLSFTSYHSQE